MAKRLRELYGILVFGQDFIFSRPKKLFGPATFELQIYRLIVLCSWYGDRNVFDQNDFEMLFQAQSFDNSTCFTGEHFYFLMLNLL